MVCAPVRRVNPRALASRYSTVQAEKNMFYLICTIISGVELVRYGYLVLTIWVSGDCGTSALTWFSFSVNHSYNYGTQYSIMVSHKS